MYTRPEIKAKPNPVGRIKGSKLIPVQEYGILNCSHLPRQYRVNPTQCLCKWHACLDSYHETLGRGEIRWRYTRPEIKAEPNIVRRIKGSKLISVQV